MFDYTALMRLLREERKLAAQSKISNNNDKNRRRYYQSTLNQMNQTRERTIRTTHMKHK